MRVSGGRNALLIIQKFLGFLLHKNFLGSSYHTKILGGNFLIRPLAKDNINLFVFYFTSLLVMFCNRYF